MAIRIKDLNSRSRIFEYINPNGGCNDNINNVTVILELQYLVRYNCFFKRRSKWITVCKITECVSNKEFSIEKLEKKLLKTHKKLRMYF
jgi:hypothetical protein